MGNASSALPGVAFTISMPLSSAVGAIRANSCRKYRYDPGSVYHGCSPNQ